jgi:hypothetical protein
MWERPSSESETHAQAQAEQSRLTAQTFEIRADADMLRKVVGGSHAEHHARLINPQSVEVI